MTPAPTLTLLYHGCPAFLHRRFPAPPPSSPPPDLALHSQQLPLRWACSRTLNSSSQLLDLPGDLNPCPGCVWLQQGLSDSHSVRLPQSSCFTVSLKCFSSDSVAPIWGPDPCSSPPPAKGGSGPNNTPVSPPSSFILRSFAWVCIYFSAGQVPLSALAWCSP